jgi:branched-chain amino acid transport system permease protein
MKLLGLLLFLAVIVVLPLVTSNVYYLTVLTVIGIYWILIASLNLLVGFTGTLSIGHVGLLGVGAYAFCILGGDSVGWNPFLAMIASGAICALVGLLLGLPSLRLPGFYFAMVTMAFGLIVTELALSEQWLTGGAAGLPSPTLPAAFESYSGFYWLVAAIAAFVTWMTWNLSRMMWGRSMIALRDNPVAASAFAVPIYRTKLIVFTFSGFTAGIAGALFAHSQTYITPDAFVFNLGIYFFVAIIIGGRGVILGPFIGAAVLAALPDIFGPLAKYATFFYGFVLLIIVLVLPGGVSDLLRRISERLSGTKVVRTEITPDLGRLRASIGTAEAK